MTIDKVSYEDTLSYVLKAVKYYEWRIATETSKKSIHEYKMMLSSVLDVKCFLLKENRYDFL